MIILENSINKRFETKKEDEYGWYADPEEVKKAKMELSSTLGGNYYISRLQKPGLKQIFLNLCSQGKNVEAIKVVIDAYHTLHSQSPQ